MSTGALSRGAGGGYVQRSSSSGLYEILDLLLDKGLVIDVFLRVSLVGIELLTVDARIVIASVDTYLRFAEAVNRLDLTDSGGQGLPEIMENITEGGAESKTKGVLEGAKEKLFGSDDMMTTSDERAAAGHAKQLAAAPAAHQVAGPGAARVRARARSTRGRSSSAAESPGERCDGQIRLWDPCRHGEHPGRARVSRTRRWSSSPATVSPRW